MFTKVLQLVLTVIPVIPQLVTSIENLFKGVPKSGSQKWIAVEQALSQTIQTAAGEIAQLAPAGTSADRISTALVVFSKDVNDAFVKLANDLQLFTSSSTPAATAAPAATKAA